ncbi:MAG: ABC transporter permease [Desulfobacterales bacterium]|nr:ABC transporter permease [Desulfobacterales bacterium]
MTEQSYIDRNYYLKRILKGGRVFFANPVGRAGVMILAVFALMALASFFLPLFGDKYDPMTGIDPLINRSVGPSLTHWLGTDNVGRDIFAQLLEGAKVAFIVGLSSAFFSIVLGTLIGMVSGYAGGVVDSMLMRLADIIMVMPSLVILLILASLFGQFNIWIIVFIIAILRWPAVSRVIRSQTLSLKQRPFIEASRVAGASHLRIIFRHIMPNVLPLAFLYMTFRVTSAILVEAALSFLGFGDPSQVSWGMMLQWVWKSGHMFQAPYWLIPPGLGISLLTLAFYMLGRAMEEVLDPRLRKDGGE